MRRITIALAESDNQRITRLVNHRNVTLFALFVGFGLALFLTLTNSWFSELFSTGLTIFFAGSGVFVANRIGWRRLVARSAAQSIGIYLVMFLVWLVLPVAYFLSPLASDLRNDAQLAHAFLSDRSCSASAMRKLSKQASVLDPARDSANTDSICSVHWARATQGFEFGYCLQLDDGRTRQYYCLPSMWQLDVFDRRRIHAGGMFVAQTAYGHPSAFLYTGRDMADYVFHPWGQVVKTKEHPDEKFIRHLMTTFWLFLIYLFLGAAVVLGILRNDRNVPA